MTRALVNLSSRPFVNRRPVVRLSLLLWLFGGILLAGNLWLYWDFLAGRGDVDARRREVGEQITVEERRIEALSSELASFDLRDQNEQVRYLNQRIAQRRFSWSGLFEELSDVLPRDVRLLSLKPSVSDDRSGRRRGTGGRRAESTLSDGRVALEIIAQARSDQAILELVDALFADPEFDRPNLIDQVQDDSGLIHFRLLAYYRPSGIEEPEVIPMEPEAVGADGGEAVVTPADGARPVPVPLGRVASAARDLS